MRLLSTFLTILTFSCLSLQAQVVSCVTIENEVADAIAGTYTFDVYIQTGTGTTGDLYLATSDVQISFTGASFSSPTLSQVANPSPPLGAIQNGYCTFVPTSTDNGGITDWLAQKAYYDAILTSVSGDLASINLNTITVSSSNILTGIARIDGTVSTHRLGKFTLSGYTGGSAGLALATSGVLRTKVFTYAAASPYTSTVTSLITCSSISLPLEWLSFEATALNNGAVALDWLTANEQQNHHFEIERRFENGEYRVIGQVETRGNSSQKTAYSFVDYQAGTGRHLYRIKQVDMNGNSSYSTESEVVIVQDYFTQIYPNPTQDVLNIRYNAFPNTTASFILMDLNGKRLSEKSWDSSSGSEYRISLHHLPEGSYVYRFNIGENVTVGKVIKL